MSLSYYCARGSIESFVVHRINALIERVVHGGSVMPVNEFPCVCANPAITHDHGATLVRGTTAYEATPADAPTSNRGLTPRER